jgi:uncharacterized membrane protein
MNLKSFGGEILAIVFVVASILLLMMLGGIAASLVLSTFLPGLLSDVVVSLVEVCSSLIVLYFGLRFILKRMARSSVSGDPHACDVGPNEEM